MQKNQIGWVAVIIISLSPLIPWIFSLPVIDRVASPYDVWSTFGEISGIVGTAMFSLALVLGARLKRLEDYFGGMNKVYIAHHLFGSIALLLILFHVVTVTLAAMTVSPHYAAIFLLPGSVIARNLGIASLLLLIALMLFTLFVRLRYEVWKFIHKFFGIAIFIGIIHGFYAPSDIAGISR